MTSLFVDLAIVLSPFVGVGVLEWWGLPSLGTGVQPAMLAMAAGLVAMSLQALRRRRVPPTGTGASGLLLGTAVVVLGSCLTWTHPSIGLLGESPWSKSLKQTLLFSFFALTALLPGHVLARSEDPWRTVRRWASALALALFAALCVAVVEFVDFQSGLPGSLALARWTSSNPSIAAGSEELYLGHSFVGIGRLRGPFPEPLHFGSFLLVAAPLVLASAGFERGWSRIGRIVLGVVGILALVLTFARGSWLGMAVVACVVGVAVARGRIELPGPARRIALAALLGAGAVVAIGGLLTGGSVAGLFDLLARRLGQSFAGHDMSNLTRWWAWRAALDAWLAAPVWGGGWGSFGFDYFRLAGPARAGAHFGWPVPNSLPLQFLAETGLVGLIAWASALRPALDAFRLHPTGALVTAALAGLLVQFLTFSQWNLPHLWLLLGAAVALAGLRRQVV